jgi:GAF domain
VTTAPPEPPPAGAAPRNVGTLWPTALAALARASRGAGSASGPEEALRELTGVCPVLLGDKEAHLRPGGLRAGERPFAISGAFMLTPDRRHNLLVAEVGFPPEQHRLRIDADLAHPGWVVKHRQPLILANTDLDAEFKQILKTARMGSALYAPMMWKGDLLGQLVCASQARNTYEPADLDVLMAFAAAGAALWVAHGGPAFIDQVA